MHHHRSVPCPGQAVGVQMLGLAVAGTAVVAAAHGRGLEAMRAAREERAAVAWGARLAGARVSAAEALSVAREAVDRVRGLEAEVAALRRAVATRDGLIRQLSGAAA